MAPKCTICDREFADEKALAQHNKDKHGMAAVPVEKKEPTYSFSAPEQEEQPEQPHEQAPKTKKKMSQRMKLIIIIIIILIIGLYNMFILTPSLLT